jgi:hypothetical protein
MTTIGKFASDHQNQIILAGGAGAGGVVGMVGASKVTSLAQDIGTVIGAGAGGKVENVHPLVARFAGARLARTGHLGDFLGKNPGLASHIGGKVAKATTDNAITGAANLIGGATGHPTAGAVTGKLINGAKHEAVSATAATIVGEAAGKGAVKGALIGGLALGGLVGLGIASVFTD